jgi:hypothetical protein
MVARLRNHLGGLLVVLAVILGSTYAVQVHNEREQAECQSEYNQAFSQQSAIRSQISTDSDNAKTALLQGVGTALALPPTTDPATQSQRAKDFLQLFTTYNQEVQRVADERQANPLPPLPNC